MLVFVIESMAENGRIYVYEDDRYPQPVLIGVGVGVGVGGRG